MENIKSGEIFKLKDKINYEESKIKTLDIIRNNNIKMVLMAFDRGTALSQHAAPGDAIVFALEGEASIVYEGEEFKIKEGENFHFAKGALHEVKTIDRFKMALFLILE